jgi:pimeloyl-ACP methyl ester carboxylesterase
MEKRALLILPGLLEDADAFASQIEALRDALNVIVADLTRAEAIADLAKHALEQAPAGPFSLAGHSMGGYVALEIMRQAPQRVQRLALLNTNARPDSPESTENRRRLMALAEKDFPAVVQSLMPKLVTAEHLLDLDISGTISEMALGIGKDAFIRQEKAIIARIDSRPHLPRIKCNTLVLAARKDALMPVELLEELARGIPRSTLAIVEDSGHMASIEQPAEVTELLEAWLET